MVSAQNVKRRTFNCDSIATDAVDINNKTILVTVFKISRVYSVLFENSKIIDTNCTDPIIAPTYISQK